MTDEDALLQIVDRITQRDGNVISPIAAAILAAAHLGFCRDSRQFSRIFDVAHALVIRDCNMLVEEAGLLSVDGKKESSQSLRYRLTQAGHDMIDQAV